MKVGQIFRLENIYWMVDEIIPQENKYHKWLKIIYSWSQFGPRPIFADESHFLIADKIPISNLE